MKSLSFIVQLKARFNKKRCGISRNLANRRLILLIIVGLCVTTKGPTLMKLVGESKVSSESKMSSSLYNLLLKVRRVALIFHDKLLLTILYN